MGDFSASGNAVTEQQFRNEAGQNLAARDRALACLPADRPVAVLRGLCKAAGT